MESNYWWPRDLKRQTVSQLYLVMRLKCKIYLYLISLEELLADLTLKEQVRAEKVYLEQPSQSGPFP